MHQYRCVYQGEIGGLPVVLMLLSSWLVPLHAMLSQKKLSQKSLHKRSLNMLLISSMYITESHMHSTIVKAGWGVIIFQKTNLEVRYIVVGLYKLISPQEGGLIIWPPSVRPYVRTYVRPSVDSDFSEVYGSTGLKL